MRTQLAVRSPECRNAVVGYVARLAESGLPVRVQDCVDTSVAGSVSEEKLELLWLPAETQRQGWEDETEMVDSQRVVMHYLHTIRLLAHDHSTALAFLHPDHVVETDREPSQVRRLPR